MKLLPANTIRLDLDHHAQVEVKLQNASKPVNRVTKFRTEKICIMVGAQSNYFNFLSNIILGVMLQIHIQGQNTYIQLFSELEPFSF